METRSRKKKDAPDENKEEQALNDEYLMKRQNKEDRLRILLGPFDKYIASLECILVWDYPIVFILILVFINFLFWLYTITPFYCLLSFCLFSCLCAQFTANHLWPLINDSDDSLDGWVKLQASGEDQFDLIRSTANLLTTLDSLYSSCELLKKNNPQKFNVIGFIFFLFILIITFFVNDFYFVYFSVMLVVCWPGIRHNHIPDRILNAIRPHLTSLEKALHIRKTVNKKKLRQRLGRKAPKRTKTRTKKGRKQDTRDVRLDQLVVSEDDSDADLQQFLPSNHDDQNDHLFPVFPSHKRGGYDDDDDDDDDDDTAREYLPHDTMLLDSGENTDDEEFIPDIGSLTSHDPQWNMVADVRERKKSPGRSKSKSKKKDDGARDGGKVVGKGGEGGGVKEVVSEEMFAEGLSFDDADDTDALTQPTIEPASLIGGLLGQAKSGSNEADLPAGGFFGKAIGGFNFLKKAVTSVYASGADEASVPVEEEFDALEAQDLDEVEEF